MKTITQQLFLLLNLAIVSTLMVACAGDNSDPIAEKYANLKGVEQHNETSDKQEAYTTHPFIIKVEGGSEDNYGEFTVGQDGIAKIRVIENNLPGKNVIQLADVKISNFPSNESYTFTPVKSDPGLFEFKWKPSVGFTQGKASRNIRVSIRATSTDGLFSEESPVVFTVTKSSKIPSIIETKGIENITATEGDVVKFEIVIRDPNYAPGFGQPRLGRYEFENADRAAFRDDASSKIQINYDVPNARSGVEHEGGGVFRFYRKMVLTDISTFRNRHNQENPNANSVDLCFLMSAKSVSGDESSPNQYCFKVNYLAQEGTLTWDSKDPIQVPQGEEKSFGFTISTQNKLSDVKLKAVRDPIVSLSGTKKIEETATDNKKEVRYTFTWKPACGANNLKKHSVELVIESKLHGKTRTTPVKFEVEAIASETNCQTSQGKGK